MKKETYIQLSLFSDTDYSIKSDPLLCPGLFEVINYFISFGPNIDPVWWGCRWSDMVVYTEFINPNQNSKGCLSCKDYPFNVWEFVKKFKKDEFVKNGLAQVFKSWA
jgi:hypothetical protein